MIVIIKWFNYPFGHSCNFVTLYTRSLKTTTKLELSKFFGSESFSFVAVLKDLDVTTLGNYRQQGPKG